MAGSSGVLAMFGPLQRRIERLAERFLAPAGVPRVDFARPAGEPALFAPDSVSRIVFKNPVTLFIGGVAAVLLELAEPRVRDGVWQHSSFRSRPLDTEDHDRFEAMARQSLDEQARLEAEPEVDFDTFVAAYQASILGLISN